MGIRRRRKKLTTVINSVDRRLRSVEYRSIPTKIKAASITPAEVAPGTIPSADPKDNGGTGAVSSPTSPVEFARITAAAYSARNITGTVDRVDITTATDHGLLVGEKVTIYGLNNNDVNLDGTYVVTEVPTSTTLRFSRGLTGYYQSVINLAVQATVTSRFCSTTTATLTLNSSTHGFVVGDVITVTDVPDDAFFNGDFKVSAVDGANVSYNFASAQTSVSVTSSAGYVKAVLHKYAIIGDTWIDTSVTPSVVKMWDGLVWTSPASLPEGVIIDDHMAPKAPTNLSAITSGYYNPTSGQPAVAVTLAWDAPTENANGTPLTDLAGYKVFYRYTKEALDGTENGTIGYEPPGQETVYGSPASADATVSGTFSWNNTFTSTVPAIGLSTNIGTLNVTVISAVKGKKTVVWTVTGLADGDAFTVSWTSSSANKYGAGSISGTLGNTTYTPSSTPAETGFSISGNIKVTSQTKSTVAATPDVTTDIPSTNEVAPDIQWINAGDTDQTSMSLRDFNVSSTIEFAVQAYDSSKMNYSEYSDILAIQTGSPAIILNAPSTPTAEARLGTITVKWDGFDDTGEIPPPYLAYTEVHLSTVSTFTPDGTTLKGRMERLGYNELVIANLTYGTTYYAKLVFVSTTGAATQASDASAGVTVVALVNTDIIGQVISGAKITPGTITASEALIGLTITGDLIQGNTIRGDSILANDITADQIRAGALDAFLITGSNIRTAASGGRVVINSGGVVAYAADGTTETFKINSADGVVTIGSYLKSGTAAADINAGTTTISGAKITTGTIDAAKLNATTSITLTDGGTKYIKFGHQSFGGNTGTVPGIVGGDTSISSTYFYLGPWLRSPSGDFGYTSSGVTFGRSSPNGFGTSITLGQSSSTIQPFISMNSGDYSGAPYVYFNANGFSVTNAGISTSSTVFASSGLRGYGPNISNDASTATGPLVLTDASGYTLKADGNEISSYSGSSGNNLYLNGSGSNGDVILGSGGGQTYAKNTLNADSVFIRTQLAGALQSSTCTITTSGAFVRTGSSRRYKSFIEDLHVDYSDILKMRPRKFKLNSDIDDLGENASFYPGFIAEELDELGLNIFVNYDYDENSEPIPDGVKYAEMSSAMVIALKHQDALIKDLTDRLAILENK